MPPPSPAALVTTTINRLDHADKDVHRFTYFERMRMVDLLPGGQMFSNTTRRYEMTYINDLPYMRLLEIDDKPLTGSALRDEQKRYDKAVAKKHDLGDAKRAKADGFTLLQSDVNLDDVLTPAYTLTEVPGAPAGYRIIDADLAPKARHKSQCTWHFRLVIDTSAEPMLARYIATATNQESEACRNSSEDLRYTLVDNIPKVTLQSVHINVDDGRGGYRAIEYYALMSDYRRFKTSITLGAATELPPDTPSEPPPAPK